MATFVFEGRSADGSAGLRVINAAPGFSPPLDLVDGVSVFEPNLPQSNFRQVILPGHNPNLGFGNEGLQFNITREGLHFIAVEASVHSPGLGGPFQIHLSRNVGVPRKLINGVAEPPRGARLDFLFNHPAPRSQILGASGMGETALLKFANCISLASGAVAVLIPPDAGGFPLGTNIIRAPDTAQALEITTPTAITPVLTNPVPGTVIDFTQIPVPASVISVPNLSGSVAAVLGVPDRVTVALPLAGGLSSLILDMGSDPGFPLRHRASSSGCQGKL